MNELIPLTETEAVLREFADAVAEQYRANLAASGRPTTADTLRNSIRTEVRVDGRDYEVTMSLADYWKYLEYGTKGQLNGSPSRRFPPPDAILRWIEVKPVLPRPMSNGKLPTPKQLAFLIGRKIRDFGTQGKADLMRAKYDVLEQFRARLAQALAHDMQGYIVKVLVEK